MTQDSFDRYLKGEAIFGDDFTPAQLAAWYEAEKEGYANLRAADVREYRYEYHGLNRALGFRHLPQGRRFQSVLGFGSAYGDELLPVASQIDRLTIIDPSDAFARGEVHGVPARYLKPTPSGNLPVGDEAFDLITCFGVLHHVPNVTHVLGELVRALVPGGFLLVREPIVSMGDWREPRHGLTKNERGIPLPLLDRLLATHPLEIVARSLCGFPVTERLLRLIWRDPYDSTFAAQIDATVAGAFRWNASYHATNLLQRFRPTSVFFVARRAPSSSPEGHSRVAVKS